MNFGSVCSGIEAASVAFGPIGWKAAWLAEIEPFPSAVLAHHYPETPNLGDMTAIAGKVRAGEVEAPDMLCGGTPCQSFSVAGLRRSLDDARGNLSLAFVELADAIDDVRADRGEPAGIVLWENVPGVLSTPDNAFGCFVAGLAGLDEPVDPGAEGWSNAGVVLGPRRVVCWRVLDAQYFGLAQRRRRVFVVASARDGFDPVAVLLESEGVRRDSAPRREAGKGITGGTSRRPDGGHVVNALTASNGQRNEVSDAVNGSVIPWPADIACTLNAAFGDKQGLEDQHALSGASLFVPVAVGVDGFNGALTGEVAATMGTSGSDTTASGPQVMVPVAFSCKDHGADAGEISPTLRSMGHDGSHANGGGQVAVAFAQNQRDEVRMMEVAGALAAEPGAKQQTYVAQPTMAVRRLTPRECERLQGFPDDYTAIPWRGKPASECPDGPRYKALGNSWAVPCAAWIGRRIDAQLRERQQAAA